MFPGGPLVCMAEETEGARKKPASEVDDPSGKGNRCSSFFGTLN